MALENMLKGLPQTIFPGAHSLSPFTNIQYMVKYILYIYSVSRKCQSAYGSDIVFIRGRYFRECKCQRFKFAMSRKSK